MAAADPWGDFGAAADRSGENPADSGQKGGLCAPGVGGGKSGSCPEAVPDGAGGYYLPFRRSGSRKVPELPQNPGGAVSPGVLPAGKDGAGRKPFVLLEGCPQRQADSLNEPSGCGPRRGHLGACPLFRGHCRRQGLRQRYGGYQMQCDGLSGSGGAAAGGRVYAPTGRVPCLLLHGGMGRRRRAQAGGGAAAPGRGAVSAV